MNINQVICQHSTRTVFILLNPIINQEYSRQLYPRILLITSYWKSHITVTNTMMPFFLWTHSPVTCLTIKKMPVWSHSSVIYLITPSVFINLGQWNKFLSYNPTLWRQRLSPSSVVVSVVRIVVPTLNRKASHFMTLMLS